MSLRNFAVEINMAHPQPQQAQQHPPQPQGDNGPNNNAHNNNFYTPSITAPTDSSYIVINDNCILTLDAALNVAGIGKVLSVRGHELYTLYDAAGHTICQFEGTGLMQRTLTQLDTLKRQHEADRTAKAREAEELARSEKTEALERMVDAMWFMPGMPGARQAADDFAARGASLQNRQTDGVDVEPREASRDWTQSVD